MIGKLDRRITIKHFTESENSIGSVVLTPDTSKEIWANVKAKSGVPYFGEGSKEFNYDYEIKFRWEQSRPVYENDLIVYENKELAIKSLIIQEEGNKKYIISKCSTLTSQTTSQV